MARPSASSTRPGEPSLADWLLLLLLVGLGGSSFALIRAAIDTIPPVAVSVGRLWIAAAMLFIIMRMKNRKWPPLMAGNKPHRLWAWMAAIGAGGYAAPFLIFPWAQQFVPSGLAGVYMAFMPLWTLGLAYFFADERLTPQKIAGFALGFAGVGILVGPEALNGFAHKGHAPSSLLAEAMLLLATLFYAASAVMARRAPAARPRAFSAGIVLMGAVFATPALLIAGDLNISEWSAKSIAAVIALGVGPTGLAGVVIIVLIRRVGASFMALANYLTPIWAIIVGVIAFGERLAPSAFIALAVIFAGVAISQRRGRKVVEAGDALIEELRPQIRRDQTES
ncbi:MAG: DMT family transporter [Parvularculaceae bacterium]